MNVKLIKPTIEYKDLIIDMLDEWSEFNRTHVTDKSPSAIFKDYSNFDVYLENIKLAETVCPPNRVTASLFFALDLDRNIIVGATQIRHYLNEKLLNSGGHIGDGVRPSERRKGYATEIIRLALIECKKMGIDKVLMACHPDNIGSKKSIINNGGVYWRTVMDDDEQLEQYWIDITGK